MPTFLELLPEVFVSSTEISSQVSQAVSEGKLKKIASRLYTKNFVDDPEVIVKRNWFNLLKEYYPDALIADRTAFDNRPAEDGSVFIISNKKRKTELPGITFNPRKGHGKLNRDLPFINDLYITSATALSPNPERGFTHSVDLADVDCDGDPDAFEGRWPNGDAPDPSMLRNNMEGTFVEATDRVTGLLTNEAVAGSAFCDLDRDGDPDLLVAMAPGLLRVFTNDGFGYYRELPDSTMPHPRSPLEENIYSDVNCADLDQDGWIDVIVHDHSFNNHYGKWQVFRNRGDMVFEEWSHILPDPEEPYLFPTGGGTSMVYDFNNDGWPDLLTGNSTNPLRILWNNGNGFTEQTLKGRWGDVRGSAPAVADLDGDGRLDIWMSMGGKDKETGEDPESWVIYQH